MDQQGLQRLDAVSGPFRGARYGRPDIQRDPEAYMQWIIEHVSEQAGDRPLEMPMGPKGAPPDRKWFVVVTDPQKERSVCDDLTREGIEPFAPLVKSLVIRKRVKCLVTRPLMPRYVFAGLPLPLPPFRVVLEAHGAREILGQSGAPVEVPSVVVIDLKRRDADGEWDDSQRQKKGYGREPAARLWKWVKPEALVRVLSGPFKHFNGIVEEVDAGRKLAKVGIAIFGRVSPVELQFDQIEHA